MVVLVVSLMDSAAMASVVTATTPSGPPVSVGVISAVSAPCTGQNAEVEQAVDPSGSGYVYEAWTGCGGIGFSRSTNGGATFSPAVTLPGSLDSPGDPDVAVAPNGMVYVSFMTVGNGQNYPVVDASFDHGATFPQVTPLVPPHADNWGDSPNLTVGPGGTVYITWDYGPSSASVVEHCTTGGSCSFTKGDLNVVIQASTDEGETFSAMVPISPGFPWSGGDNAPILVDSTGRLDVLYQGYPTNTTTHALSPALNYFTSSTNGGQTWSTPVAAGPGAGTMNLDEWWNEPSLAIDAGGTLYAAWDTQGKAWDGNPVDTGWLSYSTNGGASWSTPVQGPADTSNVPHIMEVTGGVSGQADVAWLSDSNPQGYALYLRPFSVADGWLSSAHRISKLFGSPDVWPGDTFGLSTLSPTRLVVSWGSAVPSDDTDSAIFGAAVSLSAGK
jgi:hypothetical protein